MEREYFEDLDVDERIIGVLRKLCGKVGADMDGVWKRRAVKTGKKRRVS
jgi:hypothetical protein